MSTEIASHFANIYRATVAILVSEKVTAMMAEWRDRTGEPVFIDAIHTKARDA